MKISRQGCVIIFDDIQDDSFFNDISHYHSHFIIKNDNKFIGIIEI